MILTFLFKNKNHFLFFFFCIIVDTQFCYFYLKMERFTYKVIKHTSEIPEAKLNALGKKGWELCGVIYDTYGYTYYIKKKNGENNV